MKVVQLFVDFNLAYHVRLRPKHFLGASSTADSMLLSLTTPCAKDLCREARDKAPSAKDLCHKARDKALLRDNSEVILASLEEKALHNKAKLVSKGRAKIVALPCEASLSGEVILASPTRKKESLQG